MICWCFDFCLVAPRCLHAQSPLLGPAVEGRYVVLLRNGASTADASARMRALGLSHVVAHTHLGTAAVSGSADAMRALATGGELGNSLWKTVAWAVGALLVFAYPAMRSYQRAAASR